MARPFPRDDVVAVNFFFFLRYQSVSYLSLLSPFALIPLGSACLIFCYLASRARAVNCLRKRKMTNSTAMPEYIQSMQWQAR